MRRIILVMTAGVALMLASLTSAVAFHSGAPYDGDNNPSTDHPASCSDAFGVAIEHGAGLPSAAVCP